jgi:CIC family chloride channel protein
LVLLGAVVGAVSGAIVLGLREGAHLMQRLLYQLPHGQRLSALESTPFDAALIPAAGGALLGVWLYLSRGRKTRLVDLVEANALHGGKLSMLDSLVITGQTLLSNGFGASVGLEAAYTQMGGSLASKLGEVAGLRRSDLRKLVGCGAAGAIAAAFGAPLTGAFYAFELILGTYTIAALGPVVAASISAVLINALFGHGKPIVTIDLADGIGVLQVLVILACGLATGGLGILLMRLVGLVEAGFAGFRIPLWWRPALGGLLVGVLALASPVVLSAGHGALEAAFATPPLPLATLVALVVIKTLASAVSLGAGFRGGLFFASLLLGALLGQIFFWMAQSLDPSLLPDANVLMLVGMTGLAAAVVGGPLTMAFLALETSASLPLTIAVLVAAVASSTLVRETFGYSFTTWRFHLRGENIRGAHDIGGLRNLTVGKVMRRDLKTVPETMTIKEFRRHYPLGAATRVIALRGDQRYAGLVDVAAAYEEAVMETDLVAKIVTQQNSLLHPAMSAEDAQLIFEKSNADALVVVADLADPKVIGIVTEAHLLRRYASELERARNDLT